MSRIPLLPDFPRPLVFAHRGCSSLAPENTMAAFFLAKKVGAPGIELDVHRCATGELVVIHDANFQRVAGVDLTVENAPWSRIKEVDVGAGERTPLLADALAEFSRDMYLDIELKTGRIGADPLPQALAALLKDLAAADRGLPERIVVSSFNPAALYKFKRAAPEFATAIIWEDCPAVPWYLRRGEGRWLSGCDYLKPHRAAALPLAEIRKKRAGSRPVVAWTVDDPEEARRLAAAGCDGVVTNRPQDFATP